MIKYIKAHKKIFKDFIYSFIAYALPTVVLQFAVQPLIANRTSADENGLFVALFNVVKLMVGVFIMPLANLRLLRKQDCEKTVALNSFFNFLFLIAISCTALIGSIMNGFYRNLSFDVYDILKLLLVLILMGTHDYFMIEFRIALNYKKIVIDNCLIVIGYGIGMLIFAKTGIWEAIFIAGYLFGAAFVLIDTKLWRSKPGTKEGRYLVRQYTELSASDLLKNASTYCDRLIIYPVLGGFDESVYNAASIVSKAISVISSPLRNVLLSYIVNNNGLTISKKKIRKIVFPAVAVFAVAFLAFWGFSTLACDLLYPKYADFARPYIPMIIITIMIETSGAIMNIALLRFAKTGVQTIISALKLAVYLVAVLILSVLLKTGLWGFCIAILLANLTFTGAVVIGLRKNINIVE